MRKSIARYGNGGGVPTFQEYISASMPNDVNFDALPDSMKKKIKDGYDYKYRSEMQPLESRSANVPDAPVAPTTLPTISADIVAPVTTKRRAVAAAVPAMTEKPVVATPEADDDTPTIVIDPNDKSTIVEGQEASPKLDANKRKPITQAVVESDNASKQAEGAKAATASVKSVLVPGNQIGSKTAYYISKYNILDVEKQKDIYDAVRANYETYGNIKEKDIENLVLGKSTQAYKSGYADYTSNDLIAMRKSASEGGGKYTVPKPRQSFADAARTYKATKNYERNRKLDEEYSGKLETAKRSLDKTNENTDYINGMPIDTQKFKIRNGRIIDPSELIVPVDTPQMKMVVEDIDSLPIVDTPRIERVNLEPEGKAWTKEDEEKSKINDSWAKEYEEYWNAKHGMSVDGDPTDKYEALAQARLRRPIATPIATPIESERQEKVVNPLDASKRRAAGYFAGNELYGAAKWLSNEFAPPPPSVRNPRISLSRVALDRTPFDAVDERIADAGTTALRQAREVNSQGSDLAMANAAIVGQEAQAHLQNNIGRLELANQERMQNNQIANAETEYNTNAAKEENLMSLNIAMDTAARKQAALQGTEDFLLQNERAAVDFQNKADAMELQAQIALDAEKRQNQVDMAGPLSEAERTVHADADLASSSYATQKALEEANAYAVGLGYESFSSMQFDPNSDVYKQVPIPPMKQRTYDEDVKALEMVRQRQRDKYQEHYKTKYDETYAERVKKHPIFGVANNLGMLDENYKKYFQD